MNKQSLLIPSLWSKKIVQSLHFTDDGLFIEKAAADVPLFIKWHDMIGLKIKSTAIKGLYVNVGYQFSLQLKTDDNKVYTIEMNSIYGIRRRLYEQLWMDTFRLLFDFHFTHLLGYYRELHTMRQIFTLDGITIYNEGISWDSRQILPWDELEITTYARYFVIRNRFGIQYRKFLYFGSDWNACLLLDLLRELISAHNGSMHKNGTRD